MNSTLFRSTPGLEFLEVDLDGSIKNSQNTLVKHLVQVMNTKQSEICIVWRRRLLETWSSSIMIKQEHLQNILLPGFRDYISSTQNVFYVQNALTLLKNEFEEYLGNNNDVQKLLSKQIQTSIYYFQDALDSILKMQNIPPHWIFALDSLIRNTVQTALNLMYHQFKGVFTFDDIDSMNTESNLSGTIYNRQSSCLTNLDGSNPSFDEEFLYNYQSKEQFKTVKQLIQENQKTVNALTEMITEYIQEQNEFFKVVLDKISHSKRSRTMSETSLGNTSNNSNPNCKIVDEKLVDFLKNHEISQTTIEKVRQTHVYISML